MKTIVCTGDSHTWGQSAAGLMEAFQRPPVGGDLRVTDWAGRSYVNVLRDYVNSETGSSAWQYGRAEASRLDGKGIGVAGEDILLVQDGFLNLPGDCGLLRVQFSPVSADTAVRILRDGEETGRFQLPRKESKNDYHILPIRPGGGRITLRPTDCDLNIYKIEGYSGPYAVINAGVGSTTVGRFAERFFTPYVEAYEPDLVIMEAHSINDWLSGPEPGVYLENLVSMIKRIRELGAQVILLTVSPILGNQIANGRNYSLYIEASREAARKTGVPIADANLMMAGRLRELSEQGQRELYPDDWHVGDSGHLLYFETLLPFIKAYL